MGRKWAKRRQMGPTSGPLRETLTGNYYGPGLSLPVPRRGTFLKSGRGIACAARVPCRFPLSSRTCRGASCMDTHATVTVDPSSAPPQSSVTGGGGDSKPNQTVDFVET